MHIQELSYLLTGKRWILFYFYSFYTFAHSLKWVEIKLEAYFLPPATPPKNIWLTKFEFARSPSLYKVQSIDSDQSCTNPHLQPVNNQQLCLHTFLWTAGGKLTSNLDLRIILLWVDSANSWLCMYLSFFLFTQPITWLTQTDCLRFPVFLSHTFRWCLKSLSKFGLLLVCMSFLLFFFLWWICHLSSTDKFQ